MRQLLVREHASHRRALVGLKYALLHPVVRDEPLTLLASGLYTIEPWFLRGHDFATNEPGVNADALLIVHILGTGENVYSPLIGLRLLCKEDPRLLGFRHVIVDTPHDAASYLGPAEFGARVRRVLAPLLAREERVVIVGLSRGAMTAVDLGADLACERAMPVGILSLAPPLTRPNTLPASVRTIGALEPIAENFLRYLELQPWLRGFGTWVLRIFYLRFSAFVLAELHMDDPASLGLFARFIAQIDPKVACLRAVREFGLLCRVSDAELRHALSGALQRLAVSDSARVIVSWGAEDTWLEVERCRARMAEKCEQQGVPSARVSSHVLPGIGHGLGRGAEQEYSQLAQWLWQLTQHARSVEVRARTDRGVMMRGLS
ncbi:MAG: hypothetical protein RL701_5028 [Pseudomonadota bacterium]